MKKLGKLTLRDLKIASVCLESKEQQLLSGGGYTPDENDCFFEALVEIGQQLGYNSQTYQEWVSCYSDTYGGAEALYAVTNGVNETVALNFLQQNFNSATSISVDQFSPGNGVTLGYLTVGSFAHAVILNGTIGNLITYYDPELGAFNVAYANEFAGMVQIN